LRQSGRTGKHAKTKGGGNYSKNGEPTWEERTRLTEKGLTRREREECDREDFLPETSLPRKEGLKEGLKKFFYKD